MAFFAVAALAGLLAVPSAVSPQSSPAPDPAEGAQTAPFEELSRRATEARESGRLEEAASLYGEAVALQPGWAEGWWFLGSLAYDRDHHTECRDAFARLLEIDPQIGPAWGLRGLCEFALEEYGPASKHLDRALEVGPVADDPMWRVILFHQALLLLRAGRFEEATVPLRELAARPDPDPALVEACGLRLLRRTTLPRDLTDDARDLVRAAGRAECATLAGRRSEAEESFQAALERYPEERHLHYGHGILLAQAGSVEAIDEFRRETELHPDHLLAYVELAFNLLKHGRPDEAVPAAEAAVRLDPDQFVAHLALGRALVATGDLALGTFELESAARLAPGSPDVFFALARAYTQAGRKDDAAQASARFRELDEARRASETAP